MITSLPAVQFGCKKARQYIKYRASIKCDDKRHANRACRRHLNRITRGFMSDPESFYSESFSPPSLSPWDIY